MAELSTEATTTLAATLAPEDIRCGDDVAVLNEASEFPSFLWDGSALSQPQDVVRIWSKPTDAGMPLKVRSICLPFICVKTSPGESQTLDLRQVQLVRLSREYARTVRLHVKTKGSKRRSSKKKRSR